MTKLEELGGLEAARKWGDITTGISMRFIHALIEHIESLTAERDQLKKRVEELANSWRCFRCGELFTDRDKAAEHFEGDYCEDEEPWCQFVKRMEAAEKRVGDLMAWVLTQLQAARKLADVVKLWHNRQAMHSFKLEDCNHLVCAEARDFLKMLDSQAPEVTPPSSE